MSLTETKSYKVRRYFIQPELGLEERTSVVILGDFYLSPAVSEKQCYEVYQKLIKIEPALIILQGNLISSPTELFDQETVTKLKNTLKMCSRIAPTVTVLGDRDSNIPTSPSVKMDVDAIWDDIFSECKVEILRDEWLETGPFRIFGFSQDAKSVKDAFEKLSEFELEPTDDKINWFVAHSPLASPKFTKLLKNFDILSFVDAKPDSKILSTGANLIIGASLVAIPANAATPKRLLNSFKKGEITEIIFEPKAK